MDSLWRCRWSEIHLKSSVDSPVISYAVNSANDLVFVKRKEVKKTFCDSVSCWVHSDMSENENGIAKNILNYAKRFKNSEHENRTPLRYRNYAFCLFFRLWFREITTASPRRVITRLMSSEDGRHSYKSDVKTERRVFFPDSVKSLVFVAAFRARIWRERQFKDPCGIETQFWHESLRERQTNVKFHVTVTRHNNSNVTKLWARTFLAANRVSTRQHKFMFLPSFCYWNAAHRTWNYSQQPFGTLMSVKSDLTWWERINH